MYCISMLYKCYQNYKIYIITVDLPSSLLLQLSSKHDMVRESRFASRDRTAGSARSDPARLGLGFLTGGARVMRASWLSSAPTHAAR